MRPKPTRKMRFCDDNFTIRGSLTDQQIRHLDKILAEDKIDVLKDIIPRSAKMYGRDCEEIILYDAQTIAVGMAFINPYFFIGDKPGLGKTIMTAGWFAQLRKKAKEDGTKLGKLLCIQDNNNVRGWANTFKKCGINLIELSGGTAKIKKAIKTFDITDDNIDGVVTSWDSLKTNGFLEYYLDHQEHFTLGVMDEASEIKNTTNATYKNANIVASNFERNIMLNASPFETKLEDIFNQFKVLNPYVLATKKFINENYAVYTRDTWYESEYERSSSGVIKAVPKLKSSFRVSNYKNQDSLRERLKYYYIARTREQYKDELPDKIYKLHLVGMTGKMANRLNETTQGYGTILNSPTTMYPDEKISGKTVPKFAKALDLFEELAHERPVMYVYNNASQRALKEALETRGYRIEIISGEENSESVQRQSVIDEFGKGNLDGLIINIKKAVSIFGSHTMIFYDIPINPQITYQVMGRIDRGLHNDNKSYHFLVYANSPEMENMIGLASFREEHGSRFTGQEEDVYRQLIGQIEGAIIH